MPTQNDLMRLENCVDSHRVSVRAAIASDFDPSVAVELGTEEASWCALGGAMDQPSFRRLFERAFVDPSHVIFTGLIDTVICGYIHFNHLGMERFGITAKVARKFDDRELRAILSGLAGDALRTRFPHAEIAAWVAESDLASQRMLARFGYQSTSTIKDCQFLFPPRCETVRLWVQHDTFEIRPTLPGDFAALLAIKSDPEDVKWSGFSGPPDPRRFRQWFDEAISDPDQLLFTGIARSQACGYVHLRRVAETTFSVSASVAPGSRGRGIRTALSAIEALRRTIDALRVAHPGAEIEAWVAEGNFASRRMVEVLGYRSTDITRVQEFFCPARTEVMRRWLQRTGQA